jgi:FtsH-binding integral membrane protein
MFQAQAKTRPIPGAVATVGLDVRREFLKKTYVHLLGAILAFVGLEAMLVSPNGPLFDVITVPMFRVLAASQYAWLAFLAGFVVAGKVADHFARSDTSRGMQYLGLGLYVVVEAIMFVPLLAVAANVAKYEGVIPVAGVATMAIFVGLTATVFITKKDFSFIGGALSIGMMVAFALIICSILFGFHLGMIFTIAMIALAGGYVLYYTSRVMAYYRPTQHVAAALSLFSAVALLFWYVLRLFMSLRDR